MKKFLIALLAALLVVSMFAIAQADPDVLCEHTFDKVIEVLEGDSVCTAQKYKVTVCSKCGYRDPTTAQELDTTYTAPGHVWEETTLVKDATCQGGGVMQKKCAVCGLTVTYVNTLATDHKWVEIKDAYIAPTCIKKGAKKYVCEWCGELKDEEVAATNTHRFNLDLCYVKTQATCTTDGTWEGPCLDCGAIFTYDPNIKGTEKLLIKKRGHDFSDMIITKAVTCEEDGLVTYYCAHTKGDQLYKPCTEKQEDVKIPHDVEVASTLTGTVINKYHKLQPVKIGEAAGYTAYVYKCTVCGWTSAQISSKNGVPGGNGSGTTDGDGASLKPASPTAAPKPAPAPNKKGVTIPKTNDTTSSLPYVLIAVAFVGLVALVASKRKVNG